MKTYHLRDLESDLIDPAALFNKQLTEATAAAGSVAFSVPTGTTGSGFAYTPPGDPGTDGATGNYTVEVNITVANIDLEISIRPIRYNVGGTPQAFGSFSAEQNAGTTGILSFSFTNVDLGVWAAGDRLGIQYSFRDTTAHGNEALTIGANTTSEEVVTPFAAGAAGIIGDGTLALTLGASGSGTGAVVGDGTAPLALGVSGDGAVAVEGDGAVVIPLGVSGTASADIVGSGSAALSLGVAGTAQAEIVGEANIALALAVSGAGSGVSDDIFTATTAVATWSGSQVVFAPDLLFESSTAVATWTASQATFVLETLGLWAISNRVTC